MLVITTGGTIGALPYKNPAIPPDLCSFPRDGHDLVCDALTTTFASINTRSVSLEPRDSKLLDDTYRKSILNIIEAAPERAVLITHGTDTLLKTAQFLYQQFCTNPALDKKVVILTGAMTPLANGAASDGHLNLAFSLDQLINPTPALAKINIVLCDFDNQGAWKPRLYPYTPGQYEKFYGPDSRYNRLHSGGVTSGNGGKSARFAKNNDGAP